MWYNFQNNTELLITNTYMISSNKTLLTLNRCMGLTGESQVFLPLLFWFPFVVFVLWSRFKMCYVPLDLENILHAQNVRFPLIENVLTAFEIKIFSPKNEKVHRIFSSSVELFQRLDFQKYVWKSHFLRWNRLYWPYGHARFKIRYISLD